MNKEIKYMSGEEFLEGLSKQNGIFNIYQEFKTQYQN